MILFFDGLPPAVPNKNWETNISNPTENYQYFREVTTHTLHGTKQYHGKSKEVRANPYFDLKKNKLGTQRNYCCL